VSLESQEAVNEAKKEEKCVTTGIYCITNLMTGDRYVGQSKNIERRVKAHGVGTYRGKLLTYTILQKCNEAELDELEWNWVNQLNPELNSKVPELCPLRGRIWRNPRVVEAAKRRKEKRSLPS
jgi:excinuclease UvrABC nuclease subunit